MPVTADFLRYMASNGSSRAVNDNGITTPYPGQLPDSLAPGHVWSNNLTSSDPTTLAVDQSKQTVITNTVPGSGQTARATVKNTTGTPQVVTVALSSAVIDTLSSTVATTTAVTSGTGFQTSIGVDTPFGSLSGTVGGSVERTSSNETSNTTSTSTEEEFSISAMVTVPPGQTYVAQLMYSQVRATVPYTYNITIGGDVIYNAYPYYPNESAGEVAFYDKKTNAPYPGVNLNDLSTSFPGQPTFGLPYNTQRVNASLNIPGTATFTQGYEAYVLFTDQTGTTILRTSPEGSESGANVAAMPASTSSTDPPIYYAPYDPSSDIGDYITLDAAHTVVVGTPYSDEIIGGPGNDIIDADDGNNVVFGGSGNDVIMAEGSGVNTLVGGTGNDVFKLQSTAEGNLIEGGQGCNVIIADAPSTTIIGGSGNDTIQLNAQTSGGSVITDHVGINSLTIGSAPLQFEQDGYGLIILLNGDQTYNPSKDVVWTDFFEDASNSVNGMSAAYLANLTKDGAFDPGTTRSCGTFGTTYGGTLPGESHIQAGYSLPTHTSW